MLTLIVGLGLAVCLSAAAGCEEKEPAADDGDLLIHVDEEGDIEVEGDLKQDIDGDGVDDVRIDVEREN